jgi:dienelactone hydrolase
MFAQVLGLIMTVLSVGQSAPASEPSPAKGAGEGKPIAVAFAEHLRQGRFEEAAKPFGQAMRKAMGPDKLAETWKKLGDQFGDFQGFGEPRLQKTGKYEVYVFPAQWKSISLDMQVTLTPEGRIGELFFRPAGSGDDYQPPSYVDREKFKELGTEVGEDPWKLKAKLCVPVGKGKFPAVVLVHGSGPNNLDEKIGSNRPFRDLAWGLASRGIVVLRYDKRTFAHGSKMTGGDMGVREEVLDDAIAALRMMRQRPEVISDRVYMLGHSLGGCLAPTIGKLDEKLAGMVILSGSLRPIEDVILDQLEYIASLPGDNQAAAKKTLGEASEEIERFRQGKSAADAKLLGVPIAYWKDLDSYLGKGGEAAIRDYRGPVLILGGGRDYQITRKDFELWQSILKGHENVTLRWIADANHLFAEGKGMGTPAEYMGRAKHVSLLVVKGIAEWIKTGKYPEKANH